MTTPREDAPCPNCEITHPWRDHTPREDAIAALRELVFANPDGTVSFPHPGSQAAHDVLHALATLDAEAETPDPQRRWHRCEYPGCGLWHDSRDEVTP